MAESGGRANAYNGNTNTGDNSYGLFQINMLGAMGPERLKQYGLSSNSDLFDPLTNAKVAFAMSHGGKDWQPWSTYKSGAYQRYLNSGDHRVIAGDNPNTDSGGGSFGGADSGVPGMNPATTMSWKDLSSYYGFSAAFFQSDPSLKNLINEAVGTGWTVDEFKARLQATPWYQKHSQAQQQWQVLLTGSPAEAQRQIQAKATELEHQAAVLGATLSQADAMKFATQALQNGLTDTEITNGLVGHITKQKTAGAYTGSAGEAETQIRQIAADYGVPVSQQYIQSVIPGLVGGTKNLNDITDYFKGVAQSLYPGLAKQIASGVTVK